MQLEHSLVSLSKWESRWNKPFLTKQKKTLEETIDYVKCMTLTQNVKPEVYNYLTNSNINEVNRYIALPMTATQFFEEKKSPGSKEQITAELVLLLDDRLKHSVLSVRNGISINFLR